MGTASTVTTSALSSAPSTSMAALTSISSPAMMSLASNEFDDSLATSTINVSQSGIILTSTPSAASSSTNMPIIERKPVITSPTILDMPSLMEPEPATPPPPQPQAQVVVKQQFDITSIQQPDPSVLKDATSASAVVLKPSQMMIPSLPELSDISTVQLPKDQPIELDRQEHHHQS